MREIINSGKATILVSHSIPQIRRMCNKVLWLERGKQIAFGNCEKICDQYEQFIKTGVLPEKNIARAMSLGRSIYYFFGFSRSYSQA